MSNREIRFFSVVGLIFGGGLLLLGLTTSGCPAQIVGQPVTCPSALDRFTGVPLPLLIIFFSAIGLAFSFRKPRTASLDSKNIALGVLVILMLVFASTTAFEVVRTSGTTTSIVSTTTFTSTSTIFFSTTGSASSFTTTLTSCTAPTSTSSNLFYGSCLAVSGASLVSTFGELTLSFSIYGAPSLSVASVTLTVPTIHGVCALEGNGLPNNGMISTTLENGTSTNQSGVTAGQMKLNFSGCIGGISPSLPYTYILVSDWGETAFTGTVTAQ